MNNIEKVRVRFAPSPTGYLHIGGLRTALYDFLFAQKNGGTFILKIEDTDQKRYVEGAVESLIKSLEWAGLKWDEGVFTSAEIKDDKTTTIGSKTYPSVIEVGEYGPYVQSEKLDVYKKYAEQLIQEDHAYYCFCAPERLEKLRNTQIANKQAPRYDQCCTKLSPEEIEKNLKEGMSHVIRLKVPKNKGIPFVDLIGENEELTFDSNLVDDQILLKSDGYPTYHLASVIDDHDMKITHVIRGQEWLSSVPKHILLYKYLGWEKEQPKFAHVPLIFNSDGSKLSKRQGDVAVEDYIKKGYLKEALINFIVFLGWNPGEGSTQEIFSMEELIKEFKLERVHKNGAIFDIRKLDWMNAQYIKKMDINKLYKNALPFFEQKEFFRNASDDKKTEEYLKKVLTVEKERLTKFSDVGEENKFFFQDINYDKELLRWKNMSDDDLKKSLEKISLHYIKNIPDEKFNCNDEALFESELYARLIQGTEEQKMTNGEILWPLRAALTGEQKSPSPFEIAWVLGKNESLKRIEQALKLL